LLFAANDVTVRRTYAKLHALLCDIINTSCMQHKFYLLRHDTTRTSCAWRCDALVVCVVSSCSNTVDDKFFSALDLHQHQAQLLEKVRWTCQPGNKSLRRQTISQSVKSRTGQLAD